MKYIHAPNCGSNKTNEVSKTTRFCFSCDVEFDDNNNVYTIMYNGDLVDYHINEFYGLWIRE